MKFLWKLPETSEQKHDEWMNKGWVLLKEPHTVGTATVLSIPIMVMNALFTIGILYISGFRLLEQDTTTFTITIQITDIIWVLMLFVVHEFIHLLFIPNFLRSKRIWLGITFLFLFVHTEEVLTKRRYILISIAPYVIISLIFPLLFGIQGWLTPIFVFSVILNAMASSVDVLSYILIVKQVPSNAMIRNNGVKTYWKVE